MTAPDEGLPRWVRTWDKNFSLEIDTGNLDTGIQAWQNIEDFAQGRADFVVETSNALLGSEWSGDTRDSFEEHRTKLVTDLDESVSQAAIARGLLEEVRDLVHTTEERLQQIRSRLDHLPVQEDYNASDRVMNYEFWVETEDQLQLVEGAIADSDAIREEFGTQIRLLADKFDSQPWEQITPRWDAVVLGYDPDSPLPREDAGVLPFTLPGYTATGTWSLWANGDKYVTTSTPVSELNFRYDEATEMYVIEFEDKTERFLADSEFSLHTSDGTEYSVTLREDGYYEIFDQHGRNEVHRIGDGPAAPVERQSPSPLVDVVPLAP